MESYTAGVPATLSKSEGKEQQKHVSESIIMATKRASSKRSFCAVDMWGIQKNHRTSVEMRRCMQ